MARFEVLQCLVLVVVFSHFWYRCSSAGSFAITRAVNRRRNDVFRLLNYQSSCQGVVERDCQSFNAMNLSKCECYCPSSLSTFGQLYSGKWTCLNNTRIRHQAGCSIGFQGNDMTSPIRILTEQSLQKIILPSISCSIEYPESLYFKCDGNWVGLDTLIRSRGPFSTLPIVETIVGTSTKLHTLKISKAPLLSGRLISLRFRCQSPAKSLCILFKLAGTTKCAALIGSSPTNLPTMPATNESGRATTRIPSSIKDISTVTMVTPKQETQPQEISMVIVVVVAVLGIICVTATIVAIAIILLKRKRSKRAQGGSSSDHLNGSHRSSYAEPTSLQKADDGLIYDYAVVEGLRQSPWAVHKIPANTGYEIPRENNSKKLYIDIPKENESTDDVMQDLRGKSANSSLRDMDDYVTLYNDDGSPGWQSKHS